MKVKEIKDKLETLSKEIENFNDYDVCVCLLDHNRFKMQMKTIDNIHGEITHKTLYLNTTGDIT